MQSAPGAGILFATAKDIRDRLGYRCVLEVYRAIERASNEPGGGRERILTKLGYARSTMSYRFQRGREIFKLLHYQRVREGKYSFDASGESFPTRLLDKSESVAVHSPVDDKPAGGIATTVPNVMHSRVQTQYP